jgi:hypothetical protein
MKNHHFESIATIELLKATGGCHKGGGAQAQVAQAACPGCNSSSSSTSSSSFVFMQAPPAQPPPPPQQQVAARSHSATDVKVSYG